MTEQAIWKGSLTIAAEPKSTDVAPARVKHSVVVFDTLADRSPDEYVVSAAEEHLDVLAREHRMGPIWFFRERADALAFAKLSLLGLWVPGGRIPEDGWPESPMAPLLNAMKDLIDICERMDTDAQAVRPSEAEHQAALAAARAAHAKAMGSAA